MTAAAAIVSGRGTRRSGVFLVGDRKNIDCANMVTEFGYCRLFYVIVFFVNCKQNKIYMAMTRNATAKDTLGVGGLTFKRIRDFKYLEISINKKNAMRSAIRTRSNTTSRCYFTTKEMFSSNLLAEIYLAIYLAEKGSLVKKVTENELTGPKDQEEKTSAETVKYIA